MKIAVVADSHFGPRHTHACVRAHQYITEIAVKEHGCTSLVHCGDLFDKPSTPADRMNANEWVRTFMGKDRRALFVRGNHDQPQELQALEELAVNDRLWCYESPVWINLGGVRIGILPWPDVRNVDGSVADACRAILAGWAGKVDVIFTHAEIRGAGRDEGQPLRGTPAVLDPCDFEMTGAWLTCAGHIHFGQTIRHSLVYPGSPYCTEYGESWDGKGFVVVDTDKRTFTRVPIPVQPLLVINAEVSDADAVVTSAVDVEAVRRLSEPNGQTYPPRVKLRYTTTQHNAEHRRSILALRSRLLEAGAERVQIEPLVEPTSTARAPEISARGTIRAKLEYAWQVWGTQPDEANAERLFHKLEQID